MISPENEFWRKLEAGKKGGSQGCLDFIFCNSNSKLEE